MDRSRHTITKYLNDGKTHKAINEPLFMKLKTDEKYLYEVELLKLTIEHREPINVGFFILQYAKLRMLELYYNFFDKFCDVNKLEELEMDTDSIYLALAEESYMTVSNPKKETPSKRLQAFEETAETSKKLQRFLQNRCKIDFLPSNVLQNP